MLLYIMLSYLMLFAAISNAVCLHNAFFTLIFANSFCLHALSRFIDTVCLFHVLICIMHSAFNLLVFHNSMCTSFFFCFFFLCKGHVLSREIVPKNNLLFLTYDQIMINNNNGVGESFFLDYSGGSDKTFLIS